MLWTNTSLHRFRLRLGLLAGHARRHHATNIRQRVEYNLPTCYSSCEDGPSAAKSRSGLDIRSSQHATPLQGQAL